MGNRTEEGGGGGGGKPPGRNQNMCFGSEKERKKMQNFLKWKFFDIFARVSAKNFIIFLFS